MRNRKQFITQVNHLIQRVHNPKCSHLILYTGCDNIGAILPVSNICAEAPSPGRCLRCLSVIQTPPYVNPVLINNGVLSQSAVALRASRTRFAKSSLG